MKRLASVLLLVVTLQANAAMNSSLVPPPSAYQECTAEADMLFQLASMRDRGETKDEVMSNVFTHFADVNTGTLAPEQQRTLQLMVDFIFESESLAFTAYDLQQSQKQACLESKMSSK
jgi:hypothetical protein